MYRLKGLASRVRYKLTFQDRPSQNSVKTGAELMGEPGLQVSQLVGKFASEIVWIN
eukprot:SAG31_NODE_5412_length_2551_cov_1.276509_3_plen_56_part_00